MGRPKRVQLRGGVYHVMTRGNRKEPIFDDDHDRCEILAVLSDTAERYGVRIYEYCLMGNHYHFLLNTPRGNIGDAMRYLNGDFSKYSNHRHRRSGHLFGDRYRGIIVPGERYLRHASRYIVLNPVRAGLTDDPARWPWSSYRFNAGLGGSPVSLHAEWMEFAFCAASRIEAQYRYAAFVAAAMSDPREAAEDQDVFEELRRLTRRDRPLPSTGAWGKQPPLADVYRVPENGKVDRHLQIYEAHVTHGYRLADIARFLNLHPSTPSAVVRRLRRSGRV